MTYTHAGMIEELRESGLVVLSGDVVDAFDTWEAMNDLRLAILDDACKAVCRGCREKTPITWVSGEQHHVKNRHAGPWSRCNAHSILALMGQA